MKIFTSASSLLKEKNILTRNILFILFGNLITLLISLPFLSMLADSLEAKGFGVYSVVLAYAAILMMVVDLGAGKIITREIIKQGYQNSISLVGLAAPKSVIFILVLAVLLIIDPFEWGWLYVVFCVLIGLFMNLAVTARSIFNAYEKNELNVVGMVTERVVTFTASFIALQRGFGILGVLGAVTLGNFMDTAISWYFVRRKFWDTFVKTELKEHRRYLTKYFVLGLPILIVIVIASVYYRAPVILLEEQIGLESAGWFNAAFQLILVAWYLPQAVGYVIFPYFTKRTKDLNNKEGNGKTLITLGMFIFGGIVGLIFWFVSGWVINLIYGESFTPAVGILKILAFSIPFTYTTNIAQQDVISRGYENIYAILFVVMSLVGVGLFFLMVSSSGARGIATIFLCVEAVNCLLFVLASNYLNRKGLVKA